MKLGCSLDYPVKREELVSGNLMPPPMVNVCIEVEPHTASVLVDGVKTTDGTCTQVDLSAVVVIEATADGYQKYEKQIQADQSDEYLIQMIPEGEAANVQKPSQTRKEESMTPKEVTTPEGKK